MGGSRQPTSGPRPGRLQLTPWPLVSTVAPRTSRPAGHADFGVRSCSPCRRARGVPSGICSPRPAPRSCAHPRPPAGPDAPSVRRRCWATAPRTCTSSATAWARTRRPRRAGGWAATRAGSQVRGARPRPGSGGGGGGLGWGPGVRWGRSGREASAAHAGARAERPGRPSGSRL